MKTQITFLKIAVGYKKSIPFYKDLLTCLGYKVKDENDRMLNLSNGETEFFIFHSVNMTGSGIYVLDSGVSSIFFEVPSRGAVDKFYDKFLKPRKIEPRWNWFDRTDEGGKVIERTVRVNAKEEGKYSLFFETPEKITIGVLAN